VAATALTVFGLGGYFAVDAIAVGDIHELTVTLPSISVPLPPPPPPPVTTTIPTVTVPVTVTTPTPPPPPPPPRSPTPPPPPVLPPAPAPAVQVPTSATSLPPAGRAPSRAGSARRGGTGSSPAGSGQSAPAQGSGGQGFAGAGHGAGPGAAPPPIPGDEVELRIGRAGAGGFSAYVFFLAFGRSSSSFLSPAVSTLAPGAWGWQGGRNIGRAASERWRGGALGVATEGLTPTPAPGDSGRWWPYLILALGLTAIACLVMLAYRRRRPTPA